jgi:hypothetical protein
VLAEKLELDNNSSKMVKGGNKIIVNVPPKYSHWQEKLFYEHD